MFRPTFQPRHFVTTSIFKWQQHLFQQAIFQQIIRIHSRRIQWDSELSVSLCQRVDQWKSHVQKSKQISELNF